MSIHDWTRLETGDFHHLHHSWITYIADALNGGGLPPEFMSVGVGDPLPSILLFLTEYDHIPCPLEATYMQAWAVFPAMLRELMETPQGFTSPAFN